MKNRPKFVENQQRQQCEEERNVKTPNTCCSFSLYQSTLNNIVIQVLEIFSLFLSVFHFINFLFPSFVSIHLHEIMILGWFAPSIYIHFARLGFCFHSVAATAAATTPITTTTGKTNSFSSGCALKYVSISLNHYVLWCSENEMNKMNNKIRTN